MTEIKPEVFAQLLQWWGRLDDQRADRSILRRADSVSAVALSAPYQRLYRELCRVGWEDSAPDYMKDRLAAVVGLLVHVKEQSELSPAKAMSARKPGDDKPAVSELRFRRLLESPDIDALFSGLRRALPLCNHAIAIKALARDVLYWGDKTKKDWAYGYDWPSPSR